jgi:hypothetical protein
MSRSLAVPRPIVDGWWIMKRASGRQKRRFLSAASWIRMPADAHRPFTTVITGGRMNRSRS